MNRQKHPGKPHKRKAQTGDRTRGGRTWRITASWDARPDRPAVRTTTDRNARDRFITEFTSAGGYVIVEEAKGFKWRTWREFDGVEQLLTAERAAAEQARTDRLTAEAEEREQRHTADYAAQAARNVLAAHLDETAARDRLARLMAQPPARLDQRARHTAGGR
ncbi:hypothetical protein ACIBKZ_09635 [Streptomyces sp. NPDC050421]|uniref:hypothetical protein n=1 Tax=Streptomyces sp. NPDC050421 TaxID=3365613 RepID=UPI003798FF2F